VAKPKQDAIKGYVVVLKIIPEKDADPIVRIAAHYTEWHKAMELR
jgi:hypothetical protein